MIAAQSRGEGCSGDGPSVYLEQLKSLAARCGVTRLADITGLDEIGLPVWQAIRPGGRSLSVHQGKGRTALEAKIGALSEAMEAHCAERVEADGPFATPAELPPDRLAPRMSDYARSRDLPPPRGKLRWCSAADVLTGECHYLPHGLVSLDFTQREERWFERSSTGLGAGPSEAAALQTALNEVIERDAVGEWERAPLLQRMETALDLASVPFEWFDELQDRLAALNVWMRLFAPEAVIDLPVFVCWIEGPERFGSRWRRFGGSAAHGDPETALHRAVAEALQSRLTFIAAVRDDMLPSTYRAEQSPSAMQLPPVPPGFPELEWDQIAAHDQTAAAIARAVRDAGWQQIVAKRLEGDLRGTFIVKAFVPGLGSLSRSRAR